jgi:hypothetical protein
MDTNMILFACGQITSSAEVIAEKITEGDNAPDMGLLIAGCEKLEKACGN